MRYKRPAPTSWVSTERAVILLTPYCLASSFSEATAQSAAHSPFWMRSLRLSSIDVLTDRFARAMLKHS
jgi:hypothetical protein